MMFLPDDSEFSLHEAEVQLNDLGKLSIVEFDSRACARIFVPSAIVRSRNVLLMRVSLLLSPYASPRSSFRMPIVQQDRK